MPDTHFTLRAVDGSGCREVLCGNELVLEPGDDDELAVARLATAASALVGAPVAVLGMAGDNEIWVEVLEPEGLAWVECELPEGWAARAPWRQPGWYADTLAMVDRALDGAGRRRTGAAVQAKHWSISALLQVPTDAGDVWFKQVPPLFAHEGQVVTWLSQLAPHLASAPLAVGDDWWIGTAMPDAVEVSDGQSLGAIAELIELQQASVGRDDELLALGCADRRLPALLSDVAALLNREDLLGEEQRNLLDRQLPALTEQADALDALGLPATLVHGDFHGGNVRFSASGWVVYDWTDACLAHPLTDLVPYAVRDATALSERVARAVELWRPWAAGLTEQSAGPALAVGAAHQLVTYQRLADGTESATAGTWRQACGGWADQLSALLSGRLAI